jgi:5-methylcytosine-specific restriction endonuclease McrA
MNKLSLPVLVLNKNWQAIGTTNLQRAINLLLSENKNGQRKAEVVDEFSSPVTWEEWSLVKKNCDFDDRKFIRSVSGIYKIPEIIKLNGYDKFRVHRVTFSRVNIYKRDNFSCQYCGSKPGTEELTIDHIMPKSLGGKTNWKNCVVACVGCNVKKSNKLIKDIAMNLLKDPCIPKATDIKLKVRYQSWVAWLNQSYWNIELENDMNK